MMPDPTGFESRLADAFRRYSGRVPTYVDATALAREIATASAHDTGRHPGWWLFGQTHTIIRRTQIMLSPVKTITGAALVVAIGGVMLIAQPFQQRSSVPGAATDDPAMAPSFFSGSIGPGRWTIFGEESSEVRADGVVVAEGPAYGEIEFDTNDPRITGTATIISTEIDHRQGATTLAPTGHIGAVRTTLIRIVNDEGSWEGQYMDLQIDDLDFEIMAGWLTGTDAYEGLSAYFVWDFPDNALHGHITAEGPPPVPEGLPE